jgi:hypothetical protein
MVDRALRAFHARLDELYRQGGRPTIALERLLRAQGLMVLDSIRSERMRVEPLRYHLLFRWFVGLRVKKEAWHAAVSSRNGHRQLPSEFLRAVRRGGAPSEVPRTDVERATLRSSRPCRRHVGARRASA